MNTRKRRSIYFPKELLDQVPGNFCQFVEIATLYAIMHPEIRGELRQLMDKREEALFNRRK